MWFFKKGVKIISEKKMNDIINNFFDKINFFNNDKESLRRYIAAEKLEVYHFMGKNGHSILDVDKVKQDKSLQLLILQNKKVHSIIDKKIEMNKLSSTLINMNYFGDIEICDAYLKMINLPDFNKKKELITLILERLNPHRLEYALFLIEQVKNINLKMSIDHKIIFKSYNSVLLNNLDFCDKLISAFPNQEVLTSLIQYVEPETFEKMVLNENRINELKNIKNMMLGWNSFNTIKKIDMISLKIKIIEEKNILENALGSEEKSIKNINKKRL